MKNNRSILIIAAVVVVVVVGAVLVFTTRPAQAPNGVQNISPSQYQSQFGGEAPHLLLDVRTAEEFTSGYIPGAMNISVQELGSRMNEVPRDQPVVVYCRSGNRSATAAQMLIDAGYTQVYDLGGIQTWQAEGLSVTN